jgi:hypothetical protein
MQVTAGKEKNMPINSNIALGVQPIQFESPVNQLAKVLQVQQAQQGNKLNQLKMDEYGRGVERQNRLRDLVGGLGANATDEQRVNALRGGSFFDEADKLEGGILARQKSGSEVAKASAEAKAKEFETTQKKLDTAGQAFGFVLKSPTLENAHAVLDYLGQNGIYAPEQVEQYKAMVAQDPSKISQLAETAYRSVLSAKDQLSKVDTVNGGDRQVTQSVDPVTGKVSVVGTQVINQSADNAANNARMAAEGAANRGVTMRGQNMADARSQQTIAGGKVPAGYRMKVDGTMEAIPGGPADRKVGEDASKKITDAKDVLGILDEVDKLLPSSTGGYLGTGVDAGLGALGVSTSGAKTIDQLKVLQGALVSKMPKMSGPQSDKDVLLYREMAGQVGDSTIPVARRQAAAAEVRRLNEKYAGMQPGDSLKKPANAQATTSGATVGNW